MPVILQGCLHLVRIRADKLGSGIVGRSLVATALAKGALQNEQYAYREAVCLPSQLRP
jgi:hypothetical protein